MSENNDNVLFFVNHDRKEFVDVRKIGINQNELNRVLKEGIWSGESIQPLFEINDDLNSFMDISNSLTDHNNTVQPILTVDFPDAKTEVITIHRPRKKKISMNSPTLE